MKNYGKLTLIPTPIAEGLPLEPVAHALILKAITDHPESTIIVCEDAKPARRQWLSFGFPREWIEKFHYLNEHTANEKSLELLKLLKSGNHVFVMSDGGLPAFCDPGTKLVDLCHREGIKVSMSPFPHSISQALALSGYEGGKFHFYGFLPKDQTERNRQWADLSRQKYVKILMDTPYRLKKILEEAREHNISELFLATNLNAANEELYRGHPDKILKLLKEEKAEFIVVIP